MHIYIYIYIYYSQQESELMYIQEAITQLEMRIVDSVITTTGSTTGSTTSSTTINRVADKPKGRYHSTSSSNDSIEEQKSDSEYFFYQGFLSSHTFLLMQCLYYIYIDAFIY